MPEAFVTLATSDAYCMGCLVVGKCLRRHGTTRKLVVMVSPNISKEACLSLEDVFDEVIVVGTLDSRDEAHLSLLGRPDLGITFTKLHCWTLTQYTKCAFLDADTLVLCNVDEQFEREELSAAPDPGWPDCFNSGVFVFTPSLETHSCLLEHAQMCGSFDGGDQGLLNAVFSDWAIKDINKHLPFIYNLSINAIYTHLPAFHKYGHQAKIVHFLGKNKPWHVPYKQQLTTEVLQWDSNRNMEKFVNLWWEEYYSQTKTLVNEPHARHDEPIERLGTIAAGPRSILGATTPHRSLPYATSPADPPHPHSSESDSQAEDKGEKMAGGSTEKLTLETPSLSTRHQPEDPCSRPGVVSAADFEDLETSKLQEPPAEEKQEEVSGAECAVSEDEPDSATLEALKETLEHRKRWEEGRVDYMGRDAFENIRLKLDQFLD